MAVDYYSLCLNEGRKEAEYFIKAYDQFVRVQGNGSASAAEKEEARWILSSLEEYLAYTLMQERGYEWDLLKCGWKKKEENPGNDAEKKRTASGKADSKKPAGKRA